MLVQIEVLRKTNSVSVDVVNSVTNVTVETTVNTVTIGAKGDPGLSAYEIAVSNGFVGSESQWLSSIVTNSSIDGGIVF